jgi:hypothetical protein
MKTFTLILMASMAIGLSACAPKIPKEALMLKPESMQNRQMQTRRFATTDEGHLLSASTALLQDMGFTMEEANAPLGVLVASKMRDATTAGNVTLAVVATLLTRQPVAYDKEQKMRASVVTKLLPNGKEMSVRVTFQRIVFNTQGQVTTAEAIIEPEAYQEFFSKLSKSVFLEANQI